MLFLPVYRVRRKDKNTMSYRKPLFWSVIVTIITCTFLTACSLTEQSIKPDYKLKLEDLKENYSAEQATADGYVVIDNSTLLAGEKIWVDFVNSTAQGRQAHVRIYQSYSKQDNSYRVKDLRYDGEKYLLSYYDRTGDTKEEFLFQGEYKYLNRSIYSWSKVNPIPAEYYLLSDSEDATAEGYLNSLISSIYKPYNNCNMIYSRTVDSEYAKRASYGVAFCDIDKDGKEEKCYLGWGQTSGVFTFTLTAYENRELEYYNMYRTQWYHPLRFVQAENGKLQIEGVNQNSPPETHIFDITVRKGVIILKLGNTEIEPIKPEQ